MRKKIKQKCTPGNVQGDNTNQSKGYIPGRSQSRVRKKGVVKSVEYGTPGKDQPETLWEKRKAGE